jgi:hypothetical protein
MESWLDDQGRLFNPRPQVSVLPLDAGRSCVVVDDVLANPQGVVDWAAGQRFVAPTSYPYPGLVRDLPEDTARRVTDLFDQHARGRLGGRRTLGTTLRLAMVTTRPEQLDPRQWQCHRDRLNNEPAAALYAASVLYLFRDPALGGTSFYRPRRPEHEILRMTIDSQRLDAAAFGQRHGLAAGYMDGSNAYFECVARVPAAWNRMIFYDGSMFHSGDIGLDSPHALDADPRAGRLTMNGFFTCRPVAR